MSINRSTKAYKQRVKMLAKELRWPGYGRDEDGHYVAMTTEGVIRTHGAGAPRYLVEDALVLLVTESRKSADYHDRSAKEDRERADEMERRLIELRRPKLTLASGGAA